MRFAALLLACAAASAQNPRDILTLAPPPYDERIAYGEDRYQFGHLRLPAGPGPHPVVVIIHGGYWLAAYGLDYAGHMSAALTRRGFATWNIEYRRIGQSGGGYPGTLNDVAAAIDHLLSMAPAKKLDLRRVTALGHSAGGHLALWAASRERPAVRITSVVAVAPVTDLRMLHDRKMGNGIALKLMGCAPSDCPEKYRHASPMERLPIPARIAIVHGARDETIPIAMSEAFAAKASANLITLPDAGHFEMVDPRRPEWSKVEELITK